MKGDMRVLSHSKRRCKHHSGEKAIMCIQQERTKNSRIHSRANTSRMMKDQKTQTRSRVKRISRHKTRPLLGRPVKDNAADKLFQAS